MLSKLDVAVNDLFEITPNKSAAEIGASWVSYLLESQHGGWDCVPARDKAAMARLIEDYGRWLKSNDERDPVVFTGSRYLTADR